MQTTFQSGGKPIRLESAGLQGAGRHAALLLLHGAGGNVDFWLSRIAPALQSHAAPQTGVRIGIHAVRYFDSTSTTYADLAMLADGVHVPLWLQTIGDALAHLAAQPSVDPARIALVGLSLGGFLALAHAAQQPASVRALVEISGGLVEPYRSLATCTFPPTLILHGDRDTVVSPSYAQELQATLSLLNVPHRIEMLANEGHWFTPAAQVRILAATGAFLNRHL